MTSRTASLCLFGALGAALGGCAPATDGRAAPNVVLVVVDTLRADHLSCYGHARETSPHLDRLAAEGVRFERAISQAPWTTPSVASLMTSRYPSAVGVGSERAVLADELELLPELLARAGYLTGAVVSHTFCSARWNFDQGFDWFDQSNIGGHAAVTSPGVTARALEFVDWAGDEPFFLWAHYFDPHFRYVEHEGLEYGGRGDYDGPIESGLDFKYLFDRRFDLTPADLNELRRIYDSEVAFTDRWVGALLDGLRERGRYDDTLVVVTGDHGEEFGDHGDLGHARQLYRELLGVPLIVKPPVGARGVPPPGSVATHPVALLDVLPTILELAGFEALHGLEGRGLFGPTDPRPIVSETARAGGVRSVTLGEWKLIQWLEDGRSELYRISIDPRERADLAAELPDEVERLEAALARWERDTRVRVERELDLSPEELERLQALGYAGADE